MQRLVKAAVLGDAKNIRMQANCHRQWLHHGATAYSKPPPTERIGIHPGETGLHGSSDLRAPPAVLPHSVTSSLSI